MGNDRIEYCAIYLGRREQLIYILYRSEHYYMLILYTYIPKHLMTNATRIYTNSVAYLFKKIGRGGLCNHNEIIWVLCKFINNFKIN